MKIFLALCLLCIGSVFGEAIDYCDPKLCPKGVVHVACNATIGFGPACDADAKQLDIDEDLQQLIVDRHNMRRSQVAIGNLTGFPSASRMLEMTWDDDLAYVAGFNARQCVVKHDKCRSTPAYPHSGQNLAMNGGNKNFLDLKPCIINMIDNMWFIENKYCPIDIISKYGDTVQETGHFTALVQEKSGRVGCAITQYTRDKWFMTLLACNYQYNNIMGATVYTDGLPCSKCAGKCSKTNPGLCVD